MTFQFFLNTMHHHEFMFLVLIHTNALKMVSRKNVMILMIDDRNKNQAMPLKRTENPAKM